MLYIKHGLLTNNNLSLGMSNKQLLQKIIGNQGQMLTDLSTLKNDVSALIADQTKKPLKMKVRIMIDTVL